MPRRGGRGGRCGRLPYPAPAQSFQRGGRGGSLPLGSDSGFKDGDGEDQFNQVLRDEVGAIREACSKL
ncbi:hypothetical protein Q3G72_025839 [Acer saccharum]|nr:hypothetical protein Q3G72_025839 [Acer saccharum]